MKTLKTGRYIAAFWAMLLLTGCFKDVSYKTSYILSPQVQTASGETAVPLSEFRAYAFAVDTTEWTVASYEDALAGIITSRANPAEKISEPIATAEPYEQEGLPGPRFRMTIGNPSQMILAVYPAAEEQDRMYAYTQQDLGVNLPNLYVSLVFRSWKQAFSFKDGNWSFYKPFFVPPTYVDFFVEPRVQEEQESETVPVASVKAYAFAADTTDWYVASYADALKGTITSKTGASNPRTSPDFPAYSDDSDRYRMSVSDPVLMVVVVDQARELYAYSKQEVTLDPALDPAIAPLLFSPWRQEYITLDGSWRIVDEKLKPVSPASSVNKPLR